MCVCVGGVGVEVIMIPRSVCVCVCVCVCVYGTVLVYRLYIKQHANIISPISAFEIVY